MTITITGAERRAVSSTQMNSDSSRSHLICSIVISSTNIRTGSVVRGKLTLVDLAGSERVGKSGAAGDQLKEAQVIALIIDSYNTATVL
jgi:Kinesin motor domain